MYYVIAVGLLLVGVLVARLMARLTPAVAPPERGASQASSGDIASLEEGRASATLSANDDDWERVSASSPYQNSARSGDPITNAGAGTAAKTKAAATAATPTSQPAGANANANAGSGKWAALQSEIEAMLLARIEVDEKGVAQEALDWELAKESKGVTVHTAAVQGSEWRCLRGVTLIKAQPKVVCDCLMSHGDLQKADDMLENVRTVERVHAMAEVRWMRFSAVWPTAARDFCVFSSASVRGDGAYIVATRSVEQGACPPPGNAVRAAIILSGYLLRPANDGAWTELTLFSHIDFKGNIPSFVMNQLASAAPVKLLNNVNKIAIEKSRSLA